MEVDIGGKDNIEKRGLEESCLSKVERSRYLTRDQEAEFSSCLKVFSLAMSSISILQSDLRYLQNLL